MKNPISVIIMFGLLLLMIGISDVEADPKYPIKYVPPCMDGSMQEMKECIDKRILNATTEMNELNTKLIHSTPESQRMTTSLSVDVFTKYSEIMTKVMQDREINNGGYGAIKVQRFYLNLLQRRIKELKYVMSGPEDPEVIF